MSKECKDWSRNEGLKECAVGRAIFKADVRWLFDISPSGPGRTTLRDKLSEISNQEIQRLHPLKPIHEAKITDGRTSGRWWEFPR